MVLLLLFSTLQGGFVLQCADPDAPIIARKAVNDGVHGVIDRTGISTLCVFNAEVEQT